MKTKSEVKALNNSVLIKLDGVFYYMPIEEVEINGVKLSEYATKQQLQDQEQRFNDNMSKLSSACDKAIETAKNEILEDLTQKLEKGLIELSKVGF